MSHTLAELTQAGAEDDEKKAYLNDGASQTTVTRLPKNLKFEASRRARLNGMSLSAYVRNVLIRDLLEGKD